MILSVFANLNNKETEIIAKEMLSVLKNSGCEVFFDEKYRNLLSDSLCSFSEDANLMEICDIAVAIGGDGTTMKTAKKAAIFGKPALGINGGRLGFLSGIERNELNGYWIETGLFRHYDNAKNLAKNMQADGYNSVIVPNNEYYSVYHGVYDDYDKAEAVGKTLFGKGYETRIVQGSVK